MEKKKDWKETPKYEDLLVYSGGSMDKWYPLLYTFLYFLQQEYYSNNQIKKKQQQQVIGNVF